MALRRHANSPTRTTGSTTAKPASARRTYWSRTMPSPVIRWAIAVDMTSTPGSTGSNGDGKTSPAAGCRCSDHNNSIPNNAAIDSALQHRRGADRADRAAGAIESREGECDRCRSESRGPPRDRWSGAILGSSPTAMAATRREKDASDAISGPNSNGTKRGVPVRSVTTLTTPTAATSENVFRGHRNRSAFGTRARGPSPSAVNPLFASRVDRCSSDDACSSAAANAPAPHHRLRSGIDQQQVDRNGFRSKASDRIDNPGKRGAAERDSGPRFATASSSIATMVISSGGFAVPRTSVRRSVIVASTRSRNHMLPRQCAKPRPAPQRPARTSAISV